MKVHCAFCGKEIDKETAVKIKIRGEEKYFCNEDHLERYLGKNIGRSC
ncbi:MAG: hypothetical protein ACTSUJ_06910 [Candidatus Njordarchaeales archaeon]